MDELLMDGYVGIGQDPQVGRSHGPLASSNVTRGGYLAKKENFRMCKKNWFVPKRNCVQWALV
eukprot:scaffold12671_cov100-Cylindrotheca_fusiformis.AAC.2